MAIETLEEALKDQQAENKIEEETYQAAYEMCEQGLNPDCYRRPIGYDSRFNKLFLFADRAEEALNMIGVIVGDRTLDWLDQIEDIKKVLKPWWERYAREEAAKEVGRIQDIGKP